MQKELRVVLDELSLPDDERTEFDNLEKWRLLRQLARAELKVFSHCVLERDSSLLYAAAEVFKEEDAAAEVRRLGGMWRACISLPAGSAMRASLNV